MTVTVCIQDEQGKEQTHEVSDEFMELCFERARVISLEVLDLAKGMNAQQWYEIIREKASENANEVQQTIIVDMVKNLLQTGMKYSMLRMLLDVLTK